MADLILHPSTSSSIERHIADPVHALMLIGPAGSGKYSVARHIAAQLLHKSDEMLDKYAYFRTIAPIEGKAIPIETIRDLQHFTTLKIPGSTGIARLIIIESAHLMTAEAQNALLKLLEEPPENTAFILTAPARDAVLPTIGSRVRVIQVVSPDINTLKTFLSAQFSSAEIDKTLLISGGLPGLTHALLTYPEKHPLYEATVQARKLLQSTAYERLLLVDMLSKQKQLCIDVTFILGQMARMALVRSSGSATQRWQTIMKAAYTAGERLRSNTQTKLVLMQLMLEM